MKVFEPPPREVITGDKRNLEVASYVVWRVADPVLFLRASGSHELAEARLYERVSAGLSDAIGRRELSALASTDAEPLGTRRADAGGHERGRSRRARASWESRCWTSGSAGSITRWRFARPCST